MPSRTLIKDISVIPMSSNTVLAHHDVLIEDDQIISVAPTGQSVSSDVIDGRGKFLMPGLFDAHVHMDHGFSAHLLAHGVTAVRDCGNDQTIHDLLADAKSGKVLSPRLFISGRILEGDPPFWPHWPGLKNLDEAQVVIQQLVKQGVNQLKVYHTLKPALYQKVIKAAAETGLPVAGHTHDEVTLEQALDAGLKCVEHLSAFSNLGEYDYAPVTQTGYDGWYHFVKPRINSDRLKKACHSLRKHDAYLCPTLIVGQKIAELANYSELKKSVSPTVIKQEIVDSLWNPDSPKAIANIKGIRPVWFENYGVIVKNLCSTLPEIAKHATILAGTDTANPFVIPGISMWEELELLADSGLSNYQVLQAATVNPARYLGVEDELGTVQAKATANLLILPANPLEDIGNIRKLETVVLNGQPYLQKDLAQKIKPLEISS